MIDTSSPTFFISVCNSLVPYNMLSAVFDRETLRREKFFETVQEYMEFVSRIDSEIEEMNEDKEYVLASIAIRILVILAQTASEREVAVEYGVCEAFLDRVKAFTRGYLCRVIKSMKTSFGTLVPSEAPRGWSCSICMSRSNSHLCYKTKCGHFLHYSCYNALDSDSCPLCRQSM